MKHFSIAMAAVVMLAPTAPVQANDVEGVIERIDTAARTVTVQGITFETTAQTDYDDGLHRFEDLREGQRVEVDFDYRDGRHIAEEIELED